MGKRSIRSGILICKANFVDILETSSEIKKNKVIYVYTIANVRKKDNLAMAFRRLITNPESTYKNYFRSDYNTYALALNENLKIVKDKLHAGFIPEPTVRVFMPKANGMSRMYTLMSIEDQIVYQAFANIIAEAITTKTVLSRYKKTIFGNLYTNKISEFFYQKWQDSYKAYTKAVVQAYQHGYGYIASFDLTACYDSINHRLLQKIFQKYRISENCIKEFIRLLEKWESADGQSIGTGIPQGPQASGIIAEAVLFEYDAYVQDLQKTYDFKYFRYVDDIRVLSKSEEIAKWILFLLDKKSKELGLFPQSSKIAVHKITKIDDEIKRISKPLFEDDVQDATEQQEIAIKEIRKLLKATPPDLTSIKRYFQIVKHDANTNKVAISAVEKFPNLVHSFSYYVLRYPRKLPKSITDYVYNSCQDKTRQFSAGVLLEAMLFNMNQNDCSRFARLAENLLKKDRENKYIIDCRYKAMLQQIRFLYGGMTSRQIVNTINREGNWWITKELLRWAGEYADEKSVLVPVMKEKWDSDSCEVALVVANNIISNPTPYKLPLVHDLSPLVQNSLKRAGIIHRKQYSNSQINRYISEIIESPMSFSWKQHLRAEHDQLERNIFAAFCYWSTDLTAFVNLWDTIDDRICSVFIPTHTELGGYSIGNIGGINSSVKLKSKVPKFFKMVVEIHNLRLGSHLSHSKIQRTNNYTGPISAKNRRHIKNLISDGIKELVSYW